MGGLIGWSFFFFFFFLNLEAEEMQYDIIYVCTFCMQSLIIGLILVLEVVVFQYFWIMYLFLGQLLYIYWSSFLNCLLKNTNWASKKKRKKKGPTHVSRYFGLVGKRQTNFFFLGLILKWVKMWVRASFTLQCRWYWFIGRNKTFTALLKCWPYESTITETFRFQAIQSWSYLQGEQFIYQLGSELSVCGCVC